MLNFVFYNKYIKYTYMFKGIQNVTHDIASKMNNLIYFSEYEASA